MNIYGLTDKGLVREANEDSIGISFKSGEYTVAVVCDGMGGAKGGKIASQLAEEVFMTTISSELFPLTLDESSPSLDVKKIKKLMIDSIDKANSAVFSKASETDELSGMGCTLNAIVFSEKTDRLCFANVGDSRLYMITQKEIKQLSKDHSYVQYLVDTGKISAEEAIDHPQKNLITRAVGIDPHVKPDVSHIKLSSKKPTYFLLCSDGLHGLVAPERLKDIALGKDTVEGKVISLINEANSQGGLDNISAILLSINDNEKGGLKD